MDKEHQKTPQNGVFPLFVTPKIFSQKSGSVTIVPLWCSNFMQKIRKNQWTVSEIFTDGPTDQWTDGPTDKGDYKGPPQVNPGSKKTFLVLSSYPIFIARSNRYYENNL